MVINYVQTIMAVAYLDPIHYGLAIFYNPTPPRYCTCHIFELQLLILKSVETLLSPCSFYLVTFIKWFHLNRLTFYKMLVFGLSALFKIYDFLLRICAGFVSLKIKVL